MDYITTSDLETFLGRTLSAKETAQAPQAISTASELAERKSGRTWAGDPSTVTGELQVVAGGAILLARAPVLSITTLEVRDIAIGSLWQMFAAGTTYELIDSLTGRVLVAVPDGVLSRTTYVAARSVPASIKLAVEMIAAGLLLFTTTQRIGIKSMSVPGDYTVTYTDDAEVPNEAMALLAMFRKPVRFA